MGAMNRFFKQRQRCSFERDHIVLSDSLLAPVARHHHCFALFAVLTATERLRGSIGSAPHSAVLGNLDVVVTIERGNVSLFGDISNLNRCESILKVLRFGKSLPLSGCFTVSKERENTTEEECHHRNARMESTGDTEEMLSLRCPILSQFAAW